MAAVLGAKRVGASRQAIAGALIGTVIGLFFGIVGLFVGPFLGALAGELASGSSVTRAGDVGLGREAAAKGDAVRAASVRPEGASGAVPGDVRTLRKWGEEPIGQPDDAVGLEHGDRDAEQRRGKRNRPGGVAFEATSVRARTALGCRLRICCPGGRQALRGGQD